MTLAARIVYFAALVTGASVGVGFGYKSTLYRLETYGDFRHDAPPFALSDFSQAQYRHVDLEHASLALLTLAGLLEEKEKLKPEKSRKLDLAKTYTRLALLQDAAKNEQQSHSYMVAARYWYDAYGGLQDYSESEMKARQQAFDKRMEEAADRLANSR